MGYAYLRWVLWRRFFGDGAIETLFMGLHSCLFDVVLIGGFAKRKALAERKPHLKGMIEPYFRIGLESS